MKYNSVLYLTERVLLSLAAHCSSPKFVLPSRILLSSLPRLLPLPLLLPLLIRTPYGVLLQYGSAEVMPTSSGHDCCSG